MIKVNDVIEVKMSIDAVDEQEAEIKQDISQCKRRFYIRYFLNGECISSVDFEIVEDEYIEEFDDIEEFIKGDLRKTFEEITEFEIFDIDKKDYLYQKLKIKVTKLHVDVVDDFYEQYGKKLSPREKDVLRLCFGFDDGRYRTTEEVAELFGVENEDIEQKLQYAIEKIGFSLLGYYKLFYCIFGKDAPKINHINYIKLIKILNAGLETLDDKEKEVLLLRSGLIDNKEPSLRVIGEKLGLSGERVRQIESKSLRKLRRPEIYGQLMEL